MSKLFVATNGLSVWTSPDGGETLKRTHSEAGIYTGCQVWGMAMHPTGAEMLIGTEKGLFRYDDASGKYTLVPSPMDGRQVTAIAYSPHDPSLILAGTQTANLFRSEDGGRTWEDLKMPMAESVSLRFTPEGVFVEPTSPENPIKQWTRVCQILFDPEDPDFVVACVEIDDAWISKDAGRTWVRSNNGLTIGDVHGMAISHHDGRVLYATTAMGLHVSLDDGATWRFQEIDSPWQYTRTILHRPDRNGVMYMTNGDGAPGWEGRLYRSRDFGRTWEDAGLPGPVESSLYFMATDPADSDVAFAATALGQFFKTTDGGETWVRLPRRLGEVRALAVLPDRLDQTAA